MADLYLDTQGKPVTPTAGGLRLWPDNTKKAWAALDDAARITTLQSGIITNGNTATVSPGAANAYITGSNLALGASLIQVGSRFRWRFGITKSTAGTGTPAWTVVVGTLGTTGDTTRLTFTQSTAQTAVADTEVVDIEAVCRVAGSSAILAGIFRANHNIVGATGFSTPASSQTEVISAVSGAFDATLANLIVGVCVNAGTGSAWSIETVAASLLGS